MNTNKNSESLGQTLWGRLTQGTNTFLQLMAEASTGFMTYTSMDLGCSASQQEENTHWQLKNISSSVENNFSVMLMKRSVYDELARIFLI